MQVQSYLIRYKNQLYDCPKSHTVGTDNTAYYIREINIII